jgi:death-on-curing protein
MIHYQLLKKMGQQPAPLSKDGRNRLESALAKIEPYFGVENYKTVCEKASAVLEAINQNHPFADGNKRVSLIVFEKLLQMNIKNLKLRKVSQTTKEKFILNTANHHNSREERVRCCEIYIGDKI